MAGLVPAIYVLPTDTKTWMPGTRPGMTNFVTKSHFKWYFRPSSLPPAVAKAPVALLTGWLIASASVARDNVRRNHLKFERHHELASLQRSRARRCQILRRAGTGHRAAYPRPRRRIRSAPGAAARQAPNGRPLHLLRSFRAGAVRVRQGHGRTPASAYRARHRHLSVRRQDHAPRQRGQYPGNPARRDEPDDRRARHRPFRAHPGRAAKRRPKDAGLAELDRAAGRLRGNRAVVPALRGR